MSLVRAKSALDGLGTVVAAELSGNVDWFVRKHLENLWRTRVHDGGRRGLSACPLHCSRVRSWANATFFFCARSFKRVGLLLP